MEAKGFDDISTNDKTNLEAPKQESFNNGTYKSSGASFSSHSMDVTAKMPTSKITFSTMSNCAQVNVIKSVTQQDPVKVTGGRFKDRHPSVGKL